MYPGCTGLPCHTLATPPYTHGQHQHWCTHGLRCPEQEGHPELKTAPWAWVPPLKRATLPKVVTVLREVATGKTGREGTESDSVWIADGQPCL